jgi:carbonic anhydrase/acetyltransferase-like protein (isoleucine patch superfamily)
LRERQERAILWAGGSWAKEGGKAQVWIREDVFVSEDALKLFVQVVHERGEQGTSYYWNPIGDLGELQSRVMFGDVVPLLFWFPNATASPAFSDAQALDVEPKFHPFVVDVPKEQFGVDMINIPLTDYVVFPTRHWLQLLWSNFIGLGPFLWREVGGRNIGWIAWRMFLSFLKTRSFHLPRLAAGIRRLGKKCRIHPTAVVEGSWLGDNVHIGANAVVRGCVIGDNARIEDLAMVEFSILDMDSVVQRQAMVKFSLLRHNCSAAGVIQMGVMDIGSSLKRGAYLLDMTLGKDMAHVMVDGVVKEAPLGIAGCCVGANTQVGLGVRVAPGRTIPPDLVIIADPNMVVRSVSIDQEGEGPHHVFVSQGKLSQHE